MPSDTERLFGGGGGGVGPLPMPQDVFAMSTVLLVPLLPPLPRVRWAPPLNNRSSAPAEPGVLKTASKNAATHTGKSPL
jgi:hypothetical protein